MSKLHIITIETESLGNRGYIVHDGVSAAAIDVQRDYQRWIEAARRAKVRIAYVLESHMHNDYLTGGFKLAEELGAEYVIPDGSGAGFIALNIADNQSLTVGTLQLTAIHTPGHTEHHMSYAVSDGSSTAVFTGGGVLYGTVGRTDLVAPDKTLSLTAAQYDSAHKLTTKLDDATKVLPTHGFGSFCSSSDGSGATASTLEVEKRTNLVYTKSREDFIRIILAGLGPYPSYYAHMGPLNRKGPSGVEPLVIRKFTSEQMAERLSNEKTWVVDTRSRIAFAAHHPQGAIGIELGNSFATYAGWIIPWEEEIILVGDDRPALEAAYIELSRIGMDSFVAAASDDMETYQKTTPASYYRVASFAKLGMVPAAEQPFVLDVRLPSDWLESHIEGSINIPLHELRSRLDEIPSDRPIWVHCASGYRASIAAGILDALGREPVLINDDYLNAAASALRMFHSSL